MPATSAETVLPLPSRPQNPFETARLALIKRLLEMKAPVALPVFPTPGHFEGVAEHIRAAAAIFDEWLAAVGHEVRDNATVSIDAGDFEGAAAAAIDNATFACQNAAEALIDSRRNIRRAS